MKNDGLTAKRCVAVAIKDRLYQEVVIALVGPIGSGVSEGAAFLDKTLQNDFHYDVAPIMKPSDVIRQQCGLKPSLSSAKGSNERASKIGPFITAS